MNYPFLDLAQINAPYMAEIKEAVNRVITSGRYIGGEECARFENSLAEYTGGKYAVGVSNGLDALRLILRAWVDRGDLRKGDEVIVAANTYIASVLAIIDAGLVPVLAPVDMDTLNLATSRLEEALSPRTRAVMPVHLYGRACWDNNIKNFVERNNLLVIEDNAQGIGAKATVEGFNGSSVTGALGHAGAFSFYPTKNLGAMGDAGAVVTSDADLAMRVRALANYGSDRRYHNIYVGANCRLDPIQAAVLNVKLLYLKDENDHRRALAAIYDRKIKNPDIIKPRLGGEDMVWHQYVIRSAHRDDLQQYLATHGIATDIHYATPPHLQPCLAGAGHTSVNSNSASASNVIYRAVPDALRQAEQLGATVLSLPISSCTSPDIPVQVISRFSPV